MKNLLRWYELFSEGSIEYIIEFYVRFEKIHLLQYRNGRIERMIMFRKCLYNDILSFFMEARNKEIYLRGIKEYNQIMINFI